jgi:hypothetical protein
MSLKGIVCLAALAASGLTLLPAQVATSRPPLQVNPTPVPLPGPCVCEVAARGLPSAVVADALDHPERYPGWRRLRSPSSAPGPLNSQRECLSLLNPNTRYHPLFNPPAWRVGCQ